MNRVGRARRRLKLSKAETARFAAVGTTGFVVNASMLAFLHSVLGVGLIPAQVLAAETAIITNFMLHHRWTYSDYRAERLLKRFLKFNASSATGALITLTVFAVAAEGFGVFYLAALVVGAATAMLWNFMMNKLVIWPWIDPDVPDDVLKA